MDRFLKATRGMVNETNETAPGTGYTPHDGTDEEGSPHRPLQEDGPGDTENASSGGGGMTQTQEFGDGSGMLDSLSQLSQQQSHTTNWGKLVPLVPGFEETVLDEDTNSVTIGRHQSCTIRVNNVHVSSSHAAITRKKHAGDTSFVYLKDTSANGTFLNNHRIPRDKEILIQHGDEISLVVPSPQSKMDSKEKLKLDPSANNANDKSRQPFASFIFQLLNDKDRSVFQNFHGINLRKADSNLRSSSLARKKTLTALDNQIADRFEIMEQIGNGTYASVVKCVEKATGKVYAMKIFHRKWISLTDSQLEDHLSEARLLRQLSHPYIIGLYEVLRTEKNVYIVMELVHGGELFERLEEEGPYQEESAKVIFFRVLLAVRYLHENNIVHRDLKPENILLSSPHELTVPKIADFGLASTLGIDGLKSYVGTPQYFAPEVLRRSTTIAGKGTYGTGVDIWSLGVVLYVVLAAAFPFSAKDMERSVENVKWNFKPACFSNVSKQAKALIQRLLDPNPDQRPSVVDVLKDQWFDAIREQELALETRLKQEWKIRQRTMENNCPATTKPTVAMQGASKNGRVDRESVSGSAPQARCHSSGSVTMNGASENSDVDNPRTSPEQKRKRKRKSDRPQHFHRRTSARIKSKITPKEK